MENIIVVFPKIEDGKGLKGLLAKNGFHVDVVCTTGAFALEHAHSLSGGIVISGYRLPDMLYLELKESLPPQFDLLLLASERVLSQCPSDIVSISMPVKMVDFVNTIHMMFEAQYRRRRRQRSQPAVRNTEERKLIDEAKAVLMEHTETTKNVLLSREVSSLSHCWTNNATPITASIIFVLIPGKKTNSNGK